jgi:hypothetical protein
MTEKATASWNSTEMFKQELHSKKLPSRDRTFKSVENAVTFVMETLQEHTRKTAMIRTGPKSIHLTDIQAIYEGMKKKKPR